MTLKKMKKHEPEQKNIRKHFPHPLFYAYFSALVYFDNDLSCNHRSDFISIVTTGIVETSLVYFYKLGLILTVLFSGFMYNR